MSSVERKTYKNNSVNIDLVFIVASISCRTFLFYGKLRL